MIEFTYRPRVMFDDFIIQEFPVWGSTFIRISNPNFMYVGHRYDHGNGDPPPEDKLYSVLFVCRNVTW